MADVIYNSFFRDIANGSIDLDTDTIGVILATASYTPDKDHDKRDDITNELSTAGGYTAGGTDLANKSVTADNAGDKMVFTANNVTWSTATFGPCRYAILFKRRGGAASADELICCKDLGGDKTGQGGDFTLQWNASGIITIAQA